MYGPGSKAGSVRHRGYHTPFLLQGCHGKTPHVLLVGQGARDLPWNRDLRPKISPRKSTKPENLEERKQSLEVGEDNHDTIALVGLNKDGTLAGAVPPADWLKMPAASVTHHFGSGLYVDNEIGVAGATAEKTSARFCGSFSPEDACAETIRRMHD